MSTPRYAYPGGPFPRHLYRAAVRSQASSELASARYRASTAEWGVARSHVEAALTIAQLALHSDGDPRGYLSSAMESMEWVEAELVRLARGVADPDATPRQVQVRLSAAVDAMREYALGGEAR